MRMALLLFILGVSACGCSKKDTEQQTSAAAPEPERIEVQHILIAFQGSVPGKNVTRTQSEAEALAGEVLEKAKKGEDFDALVKQYTDDAFPGRYKMTNYGIPNDPSKEEYERRHMVAAFGEVGFKLSVGGVGLAKHDPATSPYGWHVIKRLQ
ncbi:MAG: peptidylprolyl isomerase [bacterium]